MSSWLREIKTQQYFGKNKKTEDSAETFVYYVGNGFGIPRHFARSFGLCLCPCYSRRTQYPMIENPSTQKERVKTKVSNANLVITLVSLL